MTPVTADDPNARPTILERYSVAAVSGGDLDMHGAAGMLRRHELGLALLRVRAEFDAIRGQISRNSATAKERAHAAERHQREAARCRAVAEKARIQQVAAAGTPAEAVAAWDRAKATAQALRHDHAAAEALRRAPADIVSERAEVLQAMTTLDHAKQLLMARASNLATKRRFMHPDTTVAMLAGKALDVYLDELCHTCDGTGTIGSAYQGEQPRKCGACRGSGSRRDTMGADGAQRAFAAILLGEMQHAAADAGAALKLRVRAD